LQDVVIGESNSWRQLPTTGWDACAVAVFFAVAAEEQGSVSTKVWLKFQSGSTSNNAQVWETWVSSMLYFDRKPHSIKLALAKKHLAAQHTDQRAPSPERAIFCS